LKDQTGDVDLRGFRFFCPFEEETKEEFKVTVLHIDVFDK